MNLPQTLQTLFGRTPSARWTMIVTTAAALALAGAASAQTPPQIGLNFVRPYPDAGGVQNSMPNSLAPTDLAGAPPYTQTNWNNLGRYGSGINPMDSSGAATAVAINWDATGTWAQQFANQYNSNAAPQGTPDGNLMNGYLDSGGSANNALGNPVDGFAGTNNNCKPWVYIQGLNAWMTANSISYYDVVIYSDGDATAGRVGEYWLQDATGPWTGTGMTLGNDLTTHTFICDRSNFVSTVTYAQVPGTVATGRLAQQGNFQGNYVVFRSLTNDSFLARKNVFATRAPINAIQIVPRATPLPAVIDPLLPAQVYAGGRAVFRAAVAGLQPMSFQWQTNGVPLSDGGSISGSATSTLTITGAGGANVASYSLVVSNALGTVTSSVAPLTLTAYVAGGYAEKIATNNPVAYWRLNDIDDPSTNYAVASDYVGGFNGIYGSATLNGLYGVTGPQPPTYPGFESGNSAVQTASAAHSWVIAPPLNLNTNAVTITAWIFPTAYNEPGSAGIVFERNGGDVSGLGYQNNNNLGYTWNNTNLSYNFTSGLIVPSNMWSFVALVVTPSNATLYLFNTNSLGIATNSSTTNAVAGFTGPTLIGDDPSSGGTPQNRAFQGSIDEVAVFNYAVSPIEIYNMYKKGLGLSVIPAVISGEPQSLALYPGRTARFSVKASGDAPLTYQWRTNGMGLVNGGRISGATGPILTISNVVAGDAATYDVVVNNVANVPATSSPATLTIVNPPSPLNAYEAALQAAGPVDYWRFNEPAASLYAYDYWGGNIATNENVSTGVAGPEPPDFPGFESTNAAYSFDGLTMDTDTKLVGLNNNLSQFSIIGWFNSAGNQIQRTGLFGQNDVNELGYHGTNLQGVVQVGIWTPNGGAAYLLQSQINPFQWYFAAGVGDGNSINFYLFSTNGAGGFEVAQATTLASTTNYGASLFPFRIGGGGILDPTGNFFAGQIDEVAVFHRALSAGELAGLFATAIGVSALPPEITQQPQPASVTLYAGRTASFSVTAVGSTPLSYQWRTNGVPLPAGGNVATSTNATLTITNVVPANAGNYDVVITNSAGSVTSSVVALGVITPALGGYEAVAGAANPLAYYRLNETSGTNAYDYFGGHNGYYGAGAIMGVPGPQNPPFAGFEANNTGVQVAAVANSWVAAPFGSLSTNTVTFTMWIEPTGTFDSFAGLVINRGGGVSGGFGYTGGQLGYTWNNNSANTYNFRSGLVPPLNAWSFVALVVSPTNAIVYMFNTNGQASATNVLAHTSDVFGNNWQIGSDNNSGGNDGSRNFVGQIDEVAVFTYCLTPAQLQQLYTVGTKGPQVTLTIQRIGTDVKLTWPQGTLMEADSVTGPWTTNTATSPYTNTPGGAQKFYRLIVQ